MVEKARSVGTADLAVPLTAPICAYLAAVVARDLGLYKHFPELPKNVKGFYDEAPSSELALPGVPFEPLIERLSAKDPEAITFFACLAALHKHRLKYTRILERQPLPTMEQVGARGLLQYGTMSAGALTAFLLWRKWIYDIDNRAAQETGYLFEPIIALSVGGTPAPAKKSPVKRRNGKGGRQVDCVLVKHAYEIKMRVTIAASGQGRWGEELDFPKDCKASGYKPVLVVFDSTPNPKLDELKRAFLSEGGEVHIGKDAWEHLDAKAGKTMSVFLEKYVRAPIEAMLKAAPETDLPDLSLHVEAERLVIGVGLERYTYPRASSAELASEPDQLPLDVEDEMPTP
ncbi:hypothetical protein HV824_19250 [Myxococcus sp. AM009]|uniref:hypothetical protein n=1 Tax=Myxococcus sp. AM009 TaxID=2745137 RepID=UPI0015960540|nr:hypothetical protein [Myxococcus sp. AM009]NVJ00248.1 hypothetical protein [Myxococcus sp. AM009]